ncbi:cytochrome c-type biogenesis protein CcmH [Ferrimicrobium acidiphilum]|uniref:cytochrome c-type biogenesis protein CcmH n=1 Tax=Ferrimicrobium acidiphilum TaxID=121039 RepID=UPI0023F02286|nr:cytochrome c-type biogenesis protein CcmH [Ferrimicrobium acidiphilum]
MTTPTKRPSRALLAWIILFAIALASVGYAVVRTPSASASARIVALEKEVRCPSCGNLAVYNSKSASSYSIASYIDHEVHAGASNQEIIDSLVASYGDTILMAPPANGVGLFLWLLPIVVGLVLAYEVYKSLSSRSPKPRSQTRALIGASPAPMVSLSVEDGRRSPFTASELAEMKLESSDDGDARRAVDASARENGEGTVSASSSGKPIRKPLFSRRFAQIGAALILVGVGALGTLLLTRPSSSSSPSLTKELASGEALAGLGAVTQARAEFDRVLATYPSDPTALAYLGWIDFNLAKTKSAKADSISMLAHAAQLGAYDASAQLYYGLVLFYGEDKPVAAVTHLNRFLATHPSKSLVQQAYRLAKPAYLAAHRKIPNTF